MRDLRDFFGQSSKLNYLIFILLLINFHLDFHLLFLFYFIFSTSINSNNHLEYIEIYKYFISFNRILDSLIN